MIKINDLVECIQEGRGTGPDCIVGLYFIVKDIENNGMLKFYFHPYHDEHTGNLAVNARAFRFKKVEVIESVQAQRTIKSVFQFHPIKPD